MTYAELLNDIFLETDTIKMNHLIVNYLNGNSYDLRAMDDAINLLDSPLTNSINTKELTFGNTALAICRILYTAGLWRSLCDFYFILLSRSFPLNFEFTRIFSQEDETQLITRYVYQDNVVRMTVDDNTPSIRIKIVKFKEVRF